MINFWMNNVHLTIYGYVRPSSYYVHAIEVIGEPNQYYSIHECVRIMESGDNFKIDRNLLSRGLYLEL